MDTYCILAHLYDDGEMVDNAASYLNENNNWMNDNYFDGGDEWRNIADESWCVRAMIVTNKNRDLVDDLVDIKVQETDSFDGGDLFKSAVLYHMLYIFLDYEATFGDKYAEDKEKYIEELVLLVENPEVRDNMVMRANILEILSLVDYSDGVLLEELYNGVLDEQKGDGSWRLDGFDAPVFTTFRVLAGLNAYENRN